MKNLFSAVLIVGLAIGLAGCELYMGHHTTPKHPTHTTKAVA